VAVALEAAKAKSADGFKLLAAGLDHVISEGQQLSLEIKKDRRRALRRISK
jgi:hypothetical protein